MSFKFMNNYVSTATKVPTLSDIMKKAQTTQKMEKTASSSATVKTAEMPEFIKKKIEEKKNKGKKEDDKEEGVDKEEKGKKDCGGVMADSKATKKVAEKDKEEAPSSGQQEAKANPHNDPKVEDGEKKSKGGSKKGEGEAESSGQLDVEPHHQKGESTQEKPGSLDTQKKASSSNGRFVRVAELSNKQKDFLRRVWSVYWPKSFIDAFLAKA